MRNIIALLMLFLTVAIGNQIILGQKKSPAKSVQSQQNSPSKPNNEPDSAESNASLEETFYWLKNKIITFGIKEYLGFDSVKRVSSYKEINLENCKLTITRKDENLDVQVAKEAPNLNNVGIYTTEIPLDQIDPLSIEAGGSAPYFTVRGFVSDKKKTIKRHSFITRSSGATFNTNDEHYVFVLGIADKEVSKSIVKALKRMVDLCGEKIDPF